MTRFIIVTFLFMGWAYYELSGGSDFEPELHPETVAEAGASAGVTNAQVEAALAAAGTTEPAPARVETPAAPARVAAIDPDPTTSVTEPSAEAEVTFVSLSESQDGTALTATEPAAEVPEVRAVDATRLNVRTGPSTGDGVLGQLTRGEQVTLVSSNGDGWSLIRLEGDGLEGWVANEFLAEN